MPNPAIADAIQPDVPAEDNLESIAAVKSNRELAMEQIEAANMARMEAETGVKLTADEPAPAEQQIEEQLADPDPAPVVKKVKIDGEERTVTEDELIRSYQKNQAADRRLEEAAQLLRAANERAAQLEAQIAQNTQPAAQPAPPADLKDEVKSTLSVIYGGDEEAAAEALTNLLTKTRGGDQPTPQPVPLNVNALADAVSEKLEFDTAYAKVKSDYPDLINDPNLEMLTAMRLQQAVDAGHPRGAALLAVAGEIYQSIGRQPAGRQPDPAPAPRPNTRQDNKERLDPVRAASSSAIPPSVIAEEADPSSVIQEMAARRLGQSLPRRTG